MKKELAFSGNNHTFAALRSTKECVIAIPTVAMASEVVAVGNCSGRKIDKFEKFDLTPLAAERVAAPLVAECFANFECRVIDTTPVNRYNLFILEVGSIQGRGIRRRFITTDTAGLPWMAK